MGRWLRELIRFSAEAIWTLWLGGLTFYIAIVVPAGTTIVGSTTQGEITSIVTGYLNGLAILASIAKLPWKQWRDRKPRTQGIMIRAGLCTAIALIACVQIWLRMLLMEKMDFVSPANANQSMIELGMSEWSFYSLHRIYLWLTTVQWGCGVAILWMQHRISNRTPES